MAKWHAGEAVVMKNICAQWAVATKQGVSSITNIGFYAQKTGPLWETIEDLLNPPKYDGRGTVKSITSQNVLLPLRGLSDEQQCDILNRVRQGSLDWKRAANLATRVKTMAAMKVRIMSELKCRDSSLPEADLQSWDLFKTKYPLCTHSPFLSKWVESLKAARWDENLPFPPPLSHLWKDRFLQDTRGLEEKKIVEV
jgi:hypothetical protein